MTRAEKALRAPVPKAAPLSVALAGRGIMARRVAAWFRTARDLLTQVDSVEDADVVFVVTHEEGGKRILSAVPDDDPRLWFDFTGYARQAGLGTSALGSLLPRSEPLPASRIVSMPGCYASSIAIPLCYLSQNRTLDLVRVWATAVGGRSTLGESKSIEEDALRTCSTESTNRHAHELRSLVGLAPERLDLRILVGDLGEGILTSFGAHTSEHSLGIPPGTVRSVSLDLDCLTWRTEDLEPGSISDHCVRLGEGPSCAFLLQCSEDGATIQGNCRLHNLDVPIGLAIGHLRRMEQSIGGGPASREGARHLAQKIRSG